MATCTNCGAAVEGRFCAGCGTPVTSPAPPAAPGTQYALPENVICALCYLLLVLSGVLFLVLAPYNQNPKIRFHAFQSIFFWVGGIAAGVALTLVNIVIVQTGFLGAALGLLLYYAFVLGGIILWLMLMYKAYSGEHWVMPVIGRMAEKQVYPSRPDMRPK